MANLYGDIPCVKLNIEVHITVSGTKCLCGREYAYTKSTRNNKIVNIIWREVEAVTCRTCKDLYQLKEGYNESISYTE